MRPSSILLPPIVALSLVSCIVEVPDAHQGGGSSTSSGYQSGNPRITTNPDGTIRATFPGDSRYAVFNRNGNLIEGGPNCNDEDNPHFPALRTGPTAVSGASRQKQIQPPFPRPPDRPNGCFRGLPPKANS
jgi:hypothetical protein